MVSSLDVYADVRAALDEYIATRSVPTLRANLRAIFKSAGDALPQDDSYRSLSVEDIPPEVRRLGRQLNWIRVLIAQLSAGGNFAAVRTRLADQYDQWTVERG